MKLFRHGGLATSILLGVLLASCASHPNEITVNAVFGPVSVVEYGHVGDLADGSWYSFLIDVPVGNSVVTEPTSAVLRIRKPDGTLLDENNRWLLKPGEVSLNWGFAAGPPEEDLEPGTYVFEVSVADKTYRTTVKVDDMTSTLSPPIVTVEEATTAAFTLSWQPVAGANLYQVQITCLNSVGEATGRETDYFTATAVTYTPDELGLTVADVCRYQVMAFGKDFREAFVAGGNSSFVKAALYRNAFEGIAIEVP